MNDVKTAIDAAQREVRIAQAQLSVIKVLAPIPTRRREQLLRFLWAAVESDCLEFVVREKP